VLKNKKIFITGGSGFVGRNIIEAFSAKYEILAPTHAELELLDENAVREYLKKHKVDIIIHSAVRPGHRNAKDASNQLINNTRMFFNLARNAHLFKKMIFLSSGCVYDQRFYEPKMKEEYFDQHVPFDETGLSKYIAAKYIEKTDNIVELRIFGIFGKYEDYTIRFISNMICKALFDLPLTIKQNRKFDYIWIKDLLPVLDYFINQNGKNKVYNVTPDQSIDLLTLAKLVLKISGKKLPIRIAKEGLGLEYSGDNSRLIKEIKSLRFTSLEKAIQCLYDWYRVNQQTINKQLLLKDK